MRDQPHTLEHITNPLLHNEKCETCNYLLRRAFNDVMPGLELGPNGADMLLRRISEIARQLWAEGPTEENVIDAQIEGIIQHGQVAP